MQVSHKAWRFGIEVTTKTARFFVPVGHDPKPEVYALKPKPKSLNPPISSKEDFCADLVNEAREFFAGYFQVEVLRGFAVITTVCDTS